MDDTNTQRYKITKVYCAAVLAIGIAGLSVLSQRNGGEENAKDKPGLSEHIQREVLGYGAGAASSDHFMARIIPSLSAFYSRYTVPFGFTTIMSSLSASKQHRQLESFFVRLMWSLFLAICAWHWKLVGFANLYIVHILSYVFRFQFVGSSLSFLLLSTFVCFYLFQADSEYMPLFTMNEDYSLSFLTNTFGIIFSLDFKVVGVFITGYFDQIFQFLSHFLGSCLDYILPISEFKETYFILYEFSGIGKDYDEEYHFSLSLFFYVNLNIQFALGYVGISYLVALQRKSNLLVTLDTSKGLMAAEGFLKYCQWFMLSVAIPYVLQRTLFECLYELEYGHFKNRLRNNVRFDQLLSTDSYFVATALEAPITPHEYEGCINNLVRLCVEIVKEKTLSLPRLLLLPALLSNQQSLLSLILPTVIVVDYFKSLWIESLTNYIENLGVIIHEAGVKRARVEAFDLQNAELLHSSCDSYDHTRRHWRDLTVDIFVLSEKKKILETLRHYCNWIYHEGILSTGIEYALARLLSVAQISAAELFVYHKAIDDSVNTLLTRSRAEAKIAKIMFEVNKLKVLYNIWEKSEELHLLNCSNNETLISPINDEGYGIHIQELWFKRGQAVIRMNDLFVQSGKIFALTGANGSGKSSFFRVMMACSTNNKPITLHSSISVGGRNGHNSPAIFMPSSDVVQVTQLIYWPLHTKPLEWILQKNLDSLGNEALIYQETVIMDLLQEVEFLGVDSESLHDDYNTLRESMRIEQRDWFSTLSGGQKAKIELIRKVFQKEHCPKILLLDESFAAVDPNSKYILFKKLRDFCTNKGSIVLVIYHSGSVVTKGAPDPGCILSTANGELFDETIHFENGTAAIMSICKD